jgi:hypothetical protein
MLDILALPELERQVVQWLLRQGETGVSSVAAHTGQDEPGTRLLLEALAEQGFVEQSDGDGEARWRARLAPKKPRPGSGGIWKVLDE